MAKRKQHITLKLFENFNSSISSRAAIINLFNFDFTKVKTLEVDFSKVSFLSRSAAHQLIKEKERYDNKYNIKVKFTNRSKMVKEMLDTVNKSLKIPQSKSIPVQRVYFSTQKEFNQFMLQI